MIIFDANFLLDEVEYREAVEQEALRQLRREMGGRSYRV